VQTNLVLFSAPIEGVDELAERRIVPARAPTEKAAAVQTCRIQWREEFMLKVIRNFSEVYSPRGKSNFTKLAKYTS